VVPGIRRGCQISFGGANCRWWATLSPFGSGVAGPDWPSVALVVASGRDRTSDGGG